MLGTDMLSVRQLRVDERIRTLCLVVISVAVLGYGAYYLRAILIRFVLAMALKYLLTPVIDVLSCHHVNSCKYKLPHHVAILIALALAASMLGVLTLVVARSIGSFAAHADVYGDRAQHLLDGLINATDTLLGPAAIAPALKTHADMQSTIMELARTHLNLSSLITSLLGSAAHVIENVIYILLFLAFLLAGSQPRSTTSSGGDVHAEAEEQIYVYIRGKVAIALLVALSNAIILWVIRVELWHVFGILTFWLYFIPNVGLAVALVLPMPLVLLDPKSGPVGDILAFVGPLAVGLVAKDVLEPVLLGNSTSLTPVAVLLAILIWGSVWGITGMVMAVPLTAVIRIYLAGLEHPLAKWVALVLAGRGSQGQVGKSTKGVGAGVAPL